MTQVHVSDKGAVRIFRGPFWAKLIFKRKRQGQKQKIRGSSCARHEPTPETATAAIGK